MVWSEQSVGWFTRIWYEIVQAKSFRWYDCMHLLNAFALVSVDVMVMFSALART